MPFNLFNGGAEDGDKEKKQKHKQSSNAYPGNAGGGYPGNAGTPHNQQPPGYPQQPSFPMPQQQQQSQYGMPTPYGAQGSYPQGNNDFNGNAMPPLPHRENNHNHGQQQSGYYPSQPNFPQQYNSQDPSRPPAPPANGYTLGPNPNYPQPPGSSHNPYNAPYNENQPAAPPVNYNLQQSGFNQPAPPSNFALSNCSGRKRALLIGINYTGTSSALRGCINDVQNLKRFIIQSYNFREIDMVILTDDQKDPSRLPTRANMISAMRWLVHDARQNDSFFLHYSGHGTSVSDKDGDEDDGTDEAICPMDYKSAGLIVDDEIHAICVAPLPPGVRLTAIFDSCHSGTAMDLPYLYSTTGELKVNNGLKDTGKQLAAAVPGLLMGNKLGALMSVGKSVMGAVKGRNAAGKARATRTSPADVIMFSGCKDSQTSADANIGGSSTGAMSYAFRTALEQNRQQSYQQLLQSIREILKRKYQQLPQLSSSHPMDMRLLFIM